MARDHRKLRVFHDAHRLDAGYLQAHEELSVFEFLNIARASGAEVAYLVQLTYALDILSKSSFLVLDRMCQQLLPQLESLVDGVERLWLEERRARRAKKIVQTKSRARNER